MTPIHQPPLTPALTPTPDVNGMHVSMGSSGNAELLERLFATCHHAREDWIASHALGRTNRDDKFPESHALDLAIVAAILRTLRDHGPTEEMVEAAANTPGMSAASAAMELHQARGYGFPEGSFDAGSPLHQAHRAMLTNLIEASEK